MLISSLRLHGTAGEMKEDLKIYVTPSFTSKSRTIKFLRVFFFIFIIFIMLDAIC